MITRWKVANFKSIRKETELEIAALTIFAGPNSSGKSTLLQSMLLVAQTLSHKVSSRSVVLNGLYTRLGQFDDLRSFRGEANQIVIGWTCKPQEQRPWGQQPGAQRFYALMRSGPRLRSVSCEVSFDVAGTNESREITQIQPRLFSTRISSVSVARTRDTRDRQCSMTIRRASTTEETSGDPWLNAGRREDPLVRESLGYVIALDKESLSEIREDFPSAVAKGCVLRHFLPERLSLGLDVAEETVRLILSAVHDIPLRPHLYRRHADPDLVVPLKVLEYIREFAAKQSSAEPAQQMRREPALTGEGLRELLVSIARLAPRLRRELAVSSDFETVVRAAVDEEQRGKKDVVLSGVPSAIADASSYLEHFFASSVRYLGPLRDEPKSLYPLAPTADPADVGLKGEDTAAVLDLHRNRSVSYIPTSAFSVDEIIPEPKLETLEAAVADWLRYLGIAENVKTQDRGKFGHELTVNMRGSERRHDLTHVGVGVSQVLPILVSSLLAEPDTTLIFEQPEIHLHPKVQTLLADFFLSMTLLGKQCVIETHSEYLVNRVRFRTAAAVQNNPWVNDIKVYFVENREGTSVFREVAINEYGAILDWPEGFFDESQRQAEAILRAATLKRRANRGSQ